MRKEKRNRYIYGILLTILMLPTLSGCNEKDDVIAIFTGKTWKLTYIAVKGDEGKMYDFWGTNTAAYKSSMDALKNDANFIVNFEGSDVNGTATGTFSGRATSATINGQWTADGVQKTLKPSNVKVSGNDRDTFLGKAFLNGLKTATRYEGDTDNLFIYYEEGQRTFMMLFHPLRN